MWPWEHLAVGYLGYSVFARLSGHPVTDRSVTAVMIGTQFPDLIDKPLWWAGLLPTGRCLTHSLLIVVPLSLLILQFGSRYDRRQLSTAFVLGYILHLPGDALPLLLEGYAHEVGFLLWPVTTVTPGAGDAVPRMFDVITSPVMFLLTNPSRALLVLGLISVWALDGFPGVSGISRLIQWLRPVSRRR